MAASCNSILLNLQCRPAAAAAPCSSSLHLVGPWTGLKSTKRSLRRNHHHLLINACATKRRGQEGSSGGGGGEEEESKDILNAFFVGKAFADAMNERVGSAVGELLSQLGRQQAQQQKEIRQFQEEVEKRARTAIAQSASAGLKEEDMMIPPKPKQEEKKNKDLSTKTE